MRFSLFLAAASDYGPFTPHVGYVSAIVSAVAMVGFLARGPLKDWEVPEDGMPKVLSRILGFLGAAFMVGGWFLATPGSIGWMLAVAAVCLVLAAFLGVRYVLLGARYKFIKEVANPDGKTVTKKPLLGGDELKPLAKKEYDEKGTTEQDFLIAVAFNEDKLWPRAARVRVLQKAALSFICSLALGAGGISWLAYVVQVRLTGKPAAEVITQKNAPGLKDVKIPEVPETEKK